jgi:hypothetical protein
MLCKYSGIKAAERIEKIRGNKISVFKAITGGSGGKGRGNLNCIYKFAGCSA